MRYTSIAFLAAALSMAAGQAFAHAELDTCSPQRGAVLRTPPTEVTIDFTEEVNPKLSLILVKDAAGKRVDRDDGHVAADNAKHFSVDLNPLVAGTYDVHWVSVAAEDGHKLTGAFKFTVAP